MAELRANLPNYKEQLSGEFAWILSKLALVNIHIDESIVVNYLVPAMAMTVATNFIAGMGAVLSNVFLILLTVIFMLFEAQAMPRRVHARYFAVGR